MSEGLEEVKFEERLNEEEEPVMRKTMKTFFSLQVKKTMNIKQQRQKLICIIHMMKIILVCLEKSAGESLEG